MQEAQAHPHCNVCGKQFVPKFRFQLESADGAIPAPYCSQSCRMRATGASSAAPVQAKVPCTACGTPFAPTLAAQTIQMGGGTAYACSPACRTRLLESTPPARTVRRIAVMNQKGGTGKTTTSVNLAAGLAQEGKRVLLIDMDSQGSVGVSLGIAGEHSIYHVLVDGLCPSQAAVPIRDNLDVVTSNETVASAEIILTGASRREKILAERCKNLTGYDYVIMDCAPSLSIVNQNALTFADHVIIPVACDYLSMVGVKQILKTLRRIEEVLVHPIEVLGVLPTFYDARARITHEVEANLRAHFGEKVFDPIRSNTRLKEAPSHRKTIYEYAPTSSAAEDYTALTRRVEALFNQAESSSQAALRAAAC